MSKRREHHHPFCPKNRNNFRRLQKAERHLYRCTCRWDRERDLAKR